MKTFVEYLDSYKSKLGITSDNQLADHLEVTRQYISNLRRNGMASDELCEKIAVAVGDHPMLVMMARDMLKGPERKALLIKDFLHLVQVMGIAGVLAVGSGHLVTASTELPSSKDYRKFGNPRRWAILAWSLLKHRRYRSIPVLSPGFC